MDDPIPFEDACHLLGMTAAETALLILRGQIRFDVRARPDAPRVGTRDIVLSETDVVAARQARWDDPASDLIRADDRIDRAAIRFGLHPTRTGKGVRGPARQDPLNPDDQEGR